MDDGDNGVQSFALLLFLIGIYGTLMIWSGNPEKDKENDR